MSTVIEKYNCTCGYAKINIEPTTRNKGTEMNQQTIKNMKLYGGGFVSRLAELWQVADAQNQKKLEDAFGDIFDKYGWWGNDR